MLKKQKHDREEFIKVAEPLIKYLCENHHPHTTVIVTSTNAELMVGEISHVTHEHLKD